MSLDSPVSLSRVGDLGSDRHNSASNLEALIPLSRLEDQRDDGRSGGLHFVPCVAAEPQIDAELAQPLSREHVD